MTAPSARPIFLGDDPLFDEHRPAGYHPERPERLVAVRRAIARAEADGAAFERLEGRDATTDELARAHRPRMIEDVLRLDGLEGAIDPDTFVSRRSVAAALRAAGTGLEVTRRTMAAGAGARGFVVARPPGHHATPRAAMGFCLFNNVAVSAAWALAHGASKVAIVDFDVHHGNGTQDVFYADPRALFLSLHQAPFYPGTGSAHEIGEGEGRGTTVNVPLSLAAGDAEYALAFEAVVVPVLETFAPDVLFVSAGFDGHARDPLASMELTERGYARMTAALARVRGGAIPVVAFLEGGYDLAAIEGSLTATLLALSGRPGPNPSAPDGAGRASDRHRDEIAHVRKVHEEFFRL